MDKETSRYRALSGVLAIALLCLLPAAGWSQDRGLAPKLPPGTIGPSRGAAGDETKPTPQAASGTSPAVGVVALPADLQLAMSPTAANAVPTQFTVKNSGLGNAQKASLLKVTLTLLPLAGEGGGGGAVGGCKPPLSQELCDLLSTLAEMYGYGPSNDNLASFCKPPLQDFEAVIQTLDPGQSQNVSKSKSNFGSLAGKLGPKPKNSYFKDITLVCVFEVKGVVDNNNDITESNEKNNEAIHYVHREVKLQ